MKLKTGILMLLVGMAVIGVTLSEVTASQQACCKVSGAGYTTGNVCASGDSWAVCDLNKGTSDYFGLVWGEYGNGNLFGQDPYNCPGAYRERLEVRSRASWYDLNGWCYY